MHTRGKIVVSALVASAALLAVGFTGCTSLLGDFDVAPPGGEDGGEGGTTDGGNLGATCANATDCSTGFCVDGVCCESACNGTCETCSGTNKGKCEPIAVGQDPDNECKPQPLSDAGADANDFDAADFDAGDGGEGGVDLDSGIHLPDSGVTVTETSCKGACDGNRKCAYPGKDTSCGTNFCNTHAEKGGYVCDGQGHCGLDIEACVAYGCVGTDCKTSCAAPIDCLASHYCDGPTNTCKPKLADSISCTNPDQCRSGFCVNSVCCDTACSDIPGAVCNKPGKVGSCQCSLNCNAGASCIVVYPDFDGDGYGDKVASLSVTGVGGNKAQVVCSDSIPTGFVQDHTDCADNDSRAHPGAGAQGSPINGTANNYDFDCDGVITKSIAEYPGGFCGFCGSPDATNTCAPPATACASTNQVGKFACPLSRLCKIDFGGGFTCYYGCGGPFAASNRTAFTQNVNCGASATTKTCGTCTSPGLTDQGDTFSPSPVQQTCR